MNTTDWCKVIFNNIREGVQKRKKREVKKNKSDSVSWGCQLLLVICYLDTFLPDEEAEKVPRLKHINNRLVEELAQKATEEDGVNEHVPINKGRKPKASKRSAHKRKGIHQDLEQDMLVIPSVECLLKAYMDKVPEVRDDMNAVVEDCRSQVAEKFEQIKAIQSRAVELVKEIEEEFHRTCHFYDDHIISKASFTCDMIVMEDKNKEVIEEMKKTNIMDISGNKLCEFKFVEALKPDGELSNFIVDALEYLWNKEWEEKAIDKIMLSQCAVDELLARNNKTGYVIRQITTATLSGKDRIFAQLLHDRHWSVVVLELEKQRVTILDSMEMDSTRGKMIDGLVRLFFSLKCLATLYRTN
ncbi:hypothetical protein QOZ80_2BG0176170 [Eleusine coracana subsp. coracana]|nr:hypothetical protein QOZ80_2BG0176170 [Eleusine coracana subsp. coracana]